MAHRVLIADEADVVRTGLRLLLNRLGGYEVVGEAIDGRSAVRMSKELSPDVVLIDIKLPGCSGSESTRQVLQAHPGAKVLVVATRVDQRRIVDVLKAGALSFVLKDRALEELPAALRAASERKIFLSPAIAKGVLEDYLRFIGDDDIDPPAGALSPRECEVLQLVAEGKTNREAAGVLAVSTKTIESHRARLMDKLGIRTVAELTRFAVREGMTPLGD